VKKFTIDLSVRRYSISMRFLICPVCRSSDVEPDTGGYTGKYHCMKCGYIGSFIIEMDEEEFRKTRKEEDL
jgi:transposase-like protein